MLFICVCGKNGELGYENDQRYGNYEERLSQRLRCPNLLSPVQLTDEPRKTGMKGKNAYLSCLCSPSCQTIWQPNRFLFCLRIKSLLLLALIDSFKLENEEEFGRERVTI